MTIKVPSSPAPELSVIMVTPLLYATSRKTIGYLRKQTVRERIELIIVAPSRDKLKLDAEELACFRSYQILEVGRVESTGSALAVGVRAARAPIVAYGEEHSYPEPDWAQILIEKHSEPYAAVGCAMGNANPQTLVSWAHMYGQFSPVVEPVESGVAPFLGGHHVSYKRDILMDYGDRLAEMLNNECALHIDLRERGYRLYLAGTAISNHVNISRISTYFSLDYLGQRGFAAARANAGQWSVIRRALYAAAIPIIPMVRLRRIIRDIYRTGRARKLLPQVLFIIVPALFCGAIGEALGYLVGDAPSIYNKRLPIELNRYAYLAKDDHQVGK